MSGSQLWHGGPSSLARDWTQGPCIGNSESQSLDHQGSPCTSRVHSSIIHSSQEVDATQVSISGWMDGHTVIYSTMKYYKAFLKRERERPSDTQSSMDESWKLYAEWNKPCTKLQIFQEWGVKCLMGTEFLILSTTELYPIKVVKMRISLLVQWLRLFAPTAGAAGLILE